MAIATLSALYASAQVTSVYDVAGSVGTYNEITGGTVLTGLPAGEDLNEKVFDGTGKPLSGKYTVLGLPIGFDFKFNNKLMDRFVIASNGYLMLGEDSVSFDNSSANSFNSMANDGYQNVVGVIPRGTITMQDNTEISYLTEGTAPNRTLTVQFKNLGVNSSMWDVIITPGQLQIKLHENGNIDMILSDWFPNNEAMPSYWSMKVGLKGEGSDRIYLDGDWTDYTISNGESDMLTWSNTVYPADGQTYTFMPPEDCEKPASQPTDMKLTSFSTHVEGSFTKTDAADHYLTLVAPGDALTEMPADGVTYSAGDKIGNATVVSYDTLSTFSTAEELSGATQYKLYVFAANSFCMFGPKYRTDEPLTAQVTTLPDAPAALTAVTEGINAAKVSANGNAAGDRILVAMTTEPAYDQWSQITGQGAFGTPKGEMTVGSEIEGGGKVVYVGEPKDGIDITDLDENTAYYFMAWSIGSDGSYSSTSTAAATATGGTVPYTPDFSKMQQQVVPLGWESENSAFQLAVVRNEPTYFVANVSQANPAEGVEKSIVSPWVQLSDESNRVLMDMNISRYANYRNSPYNSWEAGDTLMIQASTDGVNFTTIGGIGPKTTPQLETTTSYAKLRMPFDNFSGKMVKFKIVWKTFSNPTLNLKNFTVETKSDCDYPINLHVADGSIMSDKATIDWDRQGNENEWELRYKTADSEEWSDVISVLNKPFTISGLPGTSDIEVQLRAKCDPPTASAWSETLSFRSGYTVPFSETFDFNALPSSWEAKTGVLATPTVFTDTDYHGWNFMSSFFMKGLIFQPVEESTNEWMLMPTFNLGDGSANYVLNVYMTLIQEGEATNDTYDIVVSKDGTTFNEADVMKTVTGADIAQSQDGTYTFNVPLRGLKGDVRPAIYIHTDNEVPHSLMIDSVTVTPTCPVRISNITISDTTETSVTVNWETDAEKSYVFIRRAGETEKPYVETTEKTYTFTGLEPRTDYEIGLTTVCEPGDTAKVSIKRFTTLSGTGCAEPTDVVAEPSKYSFKLSWTGEAQSYNVRYRKAGTEGWTVRNTTENSYEVTELDYDTEYEYGIQAMCSNLESDTSAYTATATVKTLVETCFPPEAISIDLSYNKVTVTWTDDYPSYTLAYRPAEREDWTEVTVKGNTYTIEGLEPETRYRLRIRSINSENDSSQWSYEIAFTTKALPECETPTDLTATMDTPTSATLSWTAGDRNLRWILNWRKSDASAWTAVEGLETTSYQLTGLVENAAYIWRVMAECELNESGWSTQNRFTAVNSGISSTDITGVTAFVKNRVLNIVNPERGLIHSVRVYNAAGQLITASDVETTDNVFMPLPACDGNVLIIKIDGEGCQRTIKTAI